MSTDDLKLPDQLEDAERFQRLFVEPMVSAVKVEMQSHVENVTKIVSEAVSKVERFEERVKKLEGNQKHALLGWGVYATAVAVAMSAVWKWFTSKIHFS